MIAYNSRKNEIIITIPNSNIENLQNYRSSILEILGKIEIEKCSPELKANIKTVYELLLHLQLNNSTQSDGKWQSEEDQKNKLK